MTDKTNLDIYAASLEFHAAHPAGKVSVHLTKPLNGQRDLALAYSPGVAAPCLEIAKDPEKVDLYTARNNYVAVISNGTAVLGLGNIGSLASKPVMEGKAVLFKRFSDINAIDIEVDTTDVEAFINTVKSIGLTWGGINLEDIKAPECFEIERRLQDALDIPVFHDDQHGTAIITLAGLINAADITNREIKKMRVVISGAGAAAIACADLLRFVGVKEIIMCDSAGVIYKGRSSNMNEWKERYATTAKHRTLEEAMVDADVFIGLSARGLVSSEMVKSMAPKPIIFAMANPEPEITPAEVHVVRDDAIVATGRSDYDNQVNNVMGFPYIFRGALDVRASRVNIEMKIAAAQAIAALAKQSITEEIALAYGGRRHEYGPQYIIPVPFDSRLLPEVASAVAQAAMDSGVARKPITDMVAYKAALYNRLNPGARIVHNFYANCSDRDHTILFVEGEEHEMIQAAAEWCNHGRAILIGHEDGIQNGMRTLGIKANPALEILNAAALPDLTPYTDLLYRKQQRNGLLYRDCLRLIKRDRNVFAASLLALGKADGLVTGLSRDYLSSLGDITSVIEASPGCIPFALSILVQSQRTIFIADTAVHERPSGAQLAHIAIQSVQAVKKLGYEPRVAFLSFANFSQHSASITTALEILASETRDFEYDGAMTADVALGEKLLKLYPFCRLTAPANILIMPDLNSANITAKLTQEFGQAKLIGPILYGLSQSAQIVPMGSSSVAILESAMLAAVHSSRSNTKKE